MSPDVQAREIVRSHAARERRRARRVDAFALVGGGVTIITGALCMVVGAVQILRFIGWLVWR